MEKHSLKVKMMTKTSDGNADTSQQFKMMVKEKSKTSDGNTDSFEKVKTMVKEKKVSDYDKLPQENIKDKEINGKKTDNKGAETKPKDDTSPPKKEATVTPASLIQVKMIK